MTAERLGLQQRLDDSINDWMTADDVMADDVMTAAKIVMTADDCYGRKSLDVVSDQRDPNINIVVRRSGINELCAYSLQGDMQR